MLSSYQNYHISYKLGDTEEIKSVVGFLSSNPKSNSDRPDLTSITLTLIIPRQLSLSQRGSKLLLYLV